MSIRNLDTLFRPASIALFGVSPRRGSVGFVLARNLRRAGFAGPLMLVNPHHREIAGIPVYPDVQSLPAAPDLAVIATPPATVPPLVAALGARGTKGAVVITAGFSELGEEGRALQQKALEAARPTLLRLIGPNCVGIMVPGVGLDATFSHLPAKTGDLGFVSQSGAMITAVLDWAAPRGIGFSHVVSLGDMADVDFGDMLDYLALDPKTRAILLYIEAVTEARKFMSAARSASRNKPILVVKAGRFAEGARAAASHTGALAGSDAVYEAAFRRAGMLRVDSMAELFDAVETLALTKRQEGDRLAILTNGGGPGVLAADALAALGGRLAELAPETLKELGQMLPPTWSRGNPVDIIGDAPPERYQKALTALLCDPGVDAVLVLNCPTALARSSASARAVIEAYARLPARNLFTAWLGERSASGARRLFASARIATYETPDGAVRGFMHRVRHRRNEELLLETPAADNDHATLDPGRARSVIEKAIAGGRNWLDAGEGAEILNAYGIPSVAMRLAKDGDEAAEAAAEMGRKVALKIRSPDLTHKSEVGGVVLNLEGRESVRREAAAMLERVLRLRPAARIDGFLVEEMAAVAGGLELILGLVDDPVFGPVVLFGQGGTAVEVIGDTTLEFPPLNEALARAAIARTRISRLLRGYRGEPPAALDKIASALVRLGQVAADLPEIKELDINPFLAGAKEVVALDLRVRLAPVSPARHRLAIRPYPKHLEGGFVLEDGTPLRLRPIRPEDEPLLKDLAAHMTADDLRMRFFTAMRGLSHELAARLSQIDYDREMALIALAREGETALGVVRFAADPDNRRAEYAIAVRSDWKGRGLGTLLLRRLIEVARERGIGELFGTVLHENTAMLQMCREFGFEITSDPDDPSLARVRKPLRGEATTL